MFTRKGRHKQWLVTVYDADTDVCVVDTRILFARTADEAGNAMGLWLELEGFDLTARIEIGLYAGPGE